MARHTASVLSVPPEENTRRKLLRRFPFQPALSALVLLTACSGSPAPDAATPTPLVSGLTLAWSAEACARAAVDPDRDGLDDRCEFALARAFAPMLVVRKGGCNWDDVAVPNRPGGGYVYAVQRVPDGGPTRIAYLPAYYRDCGWTGAKCWLPLVDCAPHVGDSEAIVVDVVYPPGSGRWTTAGIFLSAHCFGRRTGGCRWYRAEELLLFDWVDGRRHGAPVVWVADGRQANYPTKAMCDRGHLRLDTCDHHDARVRFPIRTPAQNVGSRHHPIGGDGCIGADALAGSRRLVVPGSAECFWSPERQFRGWQGAGAGDGATSYFRYLAEVARF